MLDTVSKLVVEEFGFEENKEAAGTAAWSVDMLNREVIGKRRAGNLKQNDTVIYCTMVEHWFAGEVQRVTPTGFVIKHGGKLKEEVFVPYVALLTNVVSIKRELVDRFHRMKDMRLNYEDGRKVINHSLCVLDDSEASRHDVLEYVKAILNRGGTGKIWLDKSVYEYKDGSLNDRIEMAVLEKQVSRLGLLLTDNEAIYQLTTGMVN